MSAKVLLLIPVAFVLIGGALAWAGVANRRALRRFKRRAVRVEAEVISLRSEWKRMGADHHLTQLFFPTLRFTGPDGNVVEAEARSGSNPPPAKAGERVTALYLPGDPGSVRVEGFWADGALVNGCLTGLGLFFAAIGVVVLAVAVAAGALTSG